MMTHSKGNENQSGFETWSQLLSGLRICTCGTSASVGLAITRTCTTPCRSWHHCRSNTCDCDAPSVATFWTTYSRYTSFATIVSQGGIHFGRIGMWQHITNPKPYVNSFFHIDFNILQLHFSKMLKLRKLWSKMYQFTFSETIYRVHTDKMQHES